MRRQYALFVSWLTALEKHFLHWLSTDIGHKISIGLYALGMVVYGAKSFFVPFLPSQISFVFLEGILPTLAQAFSASILALLGAFVLLSSGAFSFRVRRCVENVSSLLADIPALGLAIIALLLLPYTLTVLLITAFSLCVRLTQAVLACEKNISPSYAKTAQSLRLTPWRYFWRVHIFLSFPTIVSTIRRDMPEFWLRLLGTQAIAALLNPRLTTGSGAQIVAALRDQKMIQGCVIFLLILGGIVLSYHAFFSFLLTRSKRYEVAFLTSPYEATPERRHSIWWKDIRVITVVSLIVLSVIPLGLSAQPWHDISVSGWRILLYSVPILGGCIVLYGTIGGLLIGKKNHGRKIGQWVTSLCALTPFFLFFPLIPAHSLLLLCITLSVQGLFGWSVFFSPKEPMSGKMYQTALDLRLSHVSLWRYVRLPLMLPKLTDGLVASLPLVWSQLYLAEITSRLTIFSKYEGPNFFHLSFYGDQIALVSLMTLMIFGLRHGIALPLQRHFARKYKVLS